MEVLYAEGLANHLGPEPCGGLRAEAGEKSVGGQVGGGWRRASGASRAPPRVGGWKATSRHPCTRVCLGLCAVCAPRHACMLLARALGELGMGHRMEGGAASGRVPRDAGEVRAGAGSHQQSPAAARAQGATTGSGGGGGKGGAHGDQAARHPYRTQSRARVSQALTHVWQGGRSVTLSGPRPVCRQTQGRSPMG